MRRQAVAAPAVILADNITAIPEVREAFHGILARLRDRRPDLPIHLVELGTHSTIGSVLEELRATDVAEAVFVPLDLRSATAYAPELDECVAAAESAGVRSVVSRPIGPATELLNILDELVRDALQRRSALELDGLVLVGRTGGDTRGSALLSRRARQWSAHHRLPVQLAIEEGDGAATAAAVQTLRSQGRRYIAVGGAFFAPGPAYRAHALAAKRAGAIAITAPISGSRHLNQLILARYAFGAMELLDGQPQPVTVDDDYQFLSPREQLGH